MPIRLKIKVVPGASTTGVAGWLGDALKLRIAEPPEKGKANRAVEALIADALGRPPGAVRIVSGHRSPRKTVEIDGVSMSDVRRRLGGDDRGP